MKLRDDYGGDVLMDKKTIIAIIGCLILGLLIGYEARGSENTSLKNQISFLQGQVTTLQGQITTYQTWLTSNSTKIIHLQGQIANLQRWLDSNRTQTTFL